MWVDCHLCASTGFINKKKCYLCNTHSNIYLIGQIWVEDEYEPVTEPCGPSFN